MITANAPRRNYAIYIGRVGALAVALGIGAAVASTPGVAWAEGPDESSPPAQENTENTNPPADSGITGTSAVKVPDFGEAIRKNLDRAAKDIRKTLTGVVQSSGGAHTSTRGTGTANGNIPVIVENDEQDLPDSPAPGARQQNRQQIATTTAPGPVAVATQQLHQATATVVTRIRLNVDDALRSTSQNFTGTVAPTPINGTDPGIATRYSLNDSQTTAQITAAPEPSPVIRVVIRFPGCHRVQSGSY